MAAALPVEGNLPRVCWTRAARRHRRSLQNSNTKSAISRPSQNWAMGNDAQKLTEKHQEKRSFQKRNPPHTIFSIGRVQVIQLVIKGLQNKMKVSRERLQASSLRASRQSFLRVRSPETKQSRGEQSRTWPSTTSSAVNISTCTRICFLKVLSVYKELTKSVECFDLHYIT